MGSYSAGVAVAVRSLIGLAVSPVEIGDCCNFRFHLRWVGAYAQGGFHVGSIYLRHSEGLSQANLDFLQ